MLHIILYCVFLIVFNEISIILNINMQWYSPKVVNSCRKQISWHIPMWVSSIGSLIALVPTPMHNIKCNLINYYNVYNANLHSNHSAMHAFVVYTIIIINGGREGHCRSSSSLCWPLITIKLCLGRSRQIFKIFIQFTNG